MRLLTCVEVQGALLTGNLICEKVKDLISNGLAVLLPSVVGGRHQHTAAPAAAAGSIQHKRIHQPAVSSREGCCAAGRLLRAARQRQAFARARERERARAQEN